jgi:serine protease Do
MKTKSFQLLTAGLAALATPAFALEAPADLAPAPPQVREPARKVPQFGRPKDTTTEAAQAKAAVQKAAAPFLGVITGEVPDMVADHIGLEAGQGVIVRSVVPDGPAAATGVELNDVIVKVSGTAVGSPEQLSKEIGTRKPGDSVTLDLIHKGKASTLEVKLGTRPAEFAAAELAPGGQLDLEGMPKELADRVRDAIDRDIKGMNIQPGADLQQLPQEMRNAIEEMQKRMEGAIDPPAIPPQPGAPAVQNESTIRMRDNEGSVEVKSKNGAKEVTVRDHRDNVVWSGPWDTAQDQQAAPGSVRQRIDNLNLDTDYKGPGMRLRMGRQGIHDDGKE